MVKKILIVDDEINVLKMLNVRLSSEGYQVSEATNGEMAVEMVKKEKFDLVILDIMMPKLNGIDACAAIRKDPLTASVPIIFLTALQSKKPQLQNRNKAGQDVVMAKPFDAQELLMEIKHTIGG